MPGDRLVSSTICTWILTGGQGSGQTRQRRTPRDEDRTRQYLGRGDLMLGEHQCLPHRMVVRAPPYLQGAILRMAGMVTSSRVTRPCGSPGRVFMKSAPCSRYRPPRGDGPGPAATGITSSPCSR